MDYAIAIFFLGLMVTLIVAKGVLQAQEFARTEWEQHKARNQAPGGSD
jgi:hypothetical protein